MDKVEEPAVAYRRMDASGANNRTMFIRWVRDGLRYSSFIDFVQELPFSLDEWSKILNISGRSLQRYKKENKRFDTLQSEKILQIVLLFSRGTEVFGSAQNFNIWLSTKSVALGNILPKELLDNAFGISILEEELIRIEQGVLA